MTDNLELVRRGWSAAAAGDVETIGGLLADDVRWHAAGDEHDGCWNRAQALRWMSEAIARGVEVRLLEARELDSHRVLVLLQSSARPGPHGEIVIFRDGKVAEMVVYPSADEALEAAALATG